MLEEIIKICIEAGKSVMDIFHRRETLYISKKKDCSPVTSADLVSNSIIISSLERLTPNVPILSEENVSLWTENKIVNCFWVVDPLDGTKEFLFGNCEFTINIALIENGMPILGVIYAPAMGILYTGMYHQVWKIDVHTQYRLRVGSRRLYPPIILISRFHNDHKKLNNYLMHFLDYRIVTVGSSLKFCLIAEGSAQIYPRFSFTSIWDIAAGHAIAIASGAIVDDWSGCSLHYKNFRSFIVHSGFHVYVC